MPLSVPADVRRSGKKSEVVAHIRCLYEGIFRYKKNEKQMIKDKIRIKAERKEMRRRFNIS